MKGKAEGLPEGYGKDLNEIYGRCMKADPLQRASARELLKTRYYLLTMEKFIADHGMNVFSKIPIKRYKIHSKKIESNKSKIKKGIVSSNNAIVGSPHTPVNKSKSKSKPPLLPQIGSHKIERKSSREGRVSSR